MHSFKTIAFDADDTLWHNEGLYSLTQKRFSQLLSPYQDDEIIQRELYETEMRNLKIFGYGIKGFTLSMIETAIELTGGQIAGEEIRQIIGYAKEMLQTPVKLIDEAEAVVSSLSTHYQLMLITKGDLFDQESKVAQSGLARYFDIVEIVTEKTAETYADLLEKHDLEADQFIMVGNSLRSDILPVLSAGAHAVHIPYHLTWSHEMIEPVASISDRFHELEQIDKLPALLSSLQNRRE